MNASPALSPRRMRSMLGPPPAGGPPPAVAGPARMSPAAASREREVDAGRIMTLLFVFTVAMLVVVAALLGAAAIDAWWALAVAMVVHLLMTVVDFAGVIYVFTGRIPAPREDHHPGG